ncbi:MAG TPA: folylpolyglutamate synthase/dihydrofolate synthase family protein [Myxococcales bacterium]|nr:folylpolyglutamate synthase/dihydrofolate synthase family protein [Myxococcales bacterium]
MDFARLKELLFARGNFGVKLGLERMEQACALLGSPERSAPVLHVAGTNGKGSTCAFAEAALRAKGLRTGLYTSPHLNHFCERIRIRGEPISEERAGGLLEELISRVPWALGDPGLTFFEIATLMAFLAFREVEVMVIEVGLGGRLDATNVVRPRACAVSALGLEHTRYLGPTLLHVAAEKAGIFKPGAPAVSAGQPRGAAEVLQARADALGIPLWRPGRDYRFESREGRPFCYAGPRWTVRAEPGLAGQHQRANAALACALLEASGLCEPRHAEAGLAAARWPGRLERFGDVLIDGAHNPHAARALARSLPPILQGRPLHLVFGALEDKDAKAMLDALVPLASTVHYCAPDSPRAIPPGRLLQIHPGEVHESVAGALAAARRLPGLVLCFGSLYLAGEARALLLGTPSVPMPAERL